MGISHIILLIVAGSSKRVIGTKVVIGAEVFDINIRFAYRVPNGFCPLIHFFTNRNLFNNIGRLRYNRYFSVLGHFNGSFFKRVEVGVGSRAVDGVTLHGNPLFAQPDAFFHGPFDNAAPQPDAPRLYFALSHF